MQNRSPTRLKTAACPQKRRHDPGDNAHHDYITGDGQRRKQHPPGHAALILIDRQLIGMSSEIPIHRELLAIGRNNRLECRALWKSRRSSWDRGEAKGSLGLDEARLMSGLNPETILVYKIGATPNHGADC